MGGVLPLPVLLIERQHDVGKNSTHDKERNGTPDREDRSLTHRNVLSRRG